MRRLDLKIYVHLFALPACRCFFHRPNYDQTLRLFSSFRDDANRCWKYTSKAANPNKDPALDVILSSLVSPAPQSYFVLRRALQNFDPQTVANECGFLLTRGHCLATSASDNEWTIVKNCQQLTNWTLIQPSEHRRTTQQLAQDYLECQQYQQDDAEDLLQAFCVRLDMTLGTELRGRTAADAAFNLALAGVQDESIFDKLYCVAKLEMERVGRRNSQRSKDLLHIIEKLAASGAQSKISADIKWIYNFVAQRLEERGDTFDTSTLYGDEYNLLQPRPLLWIWRFSSRLKKVDPRLKATNRLPQFRDGQKKLVLDIGCGFGVSLLGLASLDAGIESEIGVNWKNCNYLGGDLSNLSIQFAKSIATRWALSDRLQYTRMSTEDLLRQVGSDYDGQVALVMLQFPTPFQIEGAGNQQLPNQDDFMASRKIIHEIAKVIYPNGHLLVQSNCEDVAVQIRQMAIEEGLHPVPTRLPVRKPTDIPNQRTSRWLETHPTERAIGKYWSSEPLLPSQSETEVACEVPQSAAVHRCLLQAPGVEH